MNFELSGIDTPQENDVLSGRGNHVNSHQGNRRFRSYVQGQKMLYDQTPKSEKPIFAKLIVTTIRNLVPPGRFLKQDAKTGLWFDIGDRKAWDKTRQALREKISTEVTYPNPPVVTPVGAMVELLPKNMPSSNIATSSPEMQLRSMLDRQLEIAALYGRKNNMMIYGVQQQSNALAAGSTVGNQFVPCPNPEINPGGSFTPKNYTTTTQENARLVSDDVISDVIRPQINEAALNNDTPLIPDSIVSNDNKLTSSDDYKISMNQLENERWSTELSMLLDESQLDLVDGDHDNPPNTAEHVNDIMAVSQRNRKSGLRSSLKYSDSSSAVTSTKSSVVRSDRSSYTSTRSSVVRSNRSSYTSTRSSVVRSNRSSYTSDENVTGVSFSQVSEHGDDTATNESKKILQNEECSRPRLGEKQISGLTAASFCNSPNKDLVEETSCSSAVKRPSISLNQIMFDTSNQKSLLHSSILTMNGEGQGHLKDLDATMSNRSRRHSIRLMHKKCSASNLDDLSCLSGRMSICENMSMADSGIFSMSDSEFAEWGRKAAEWEMEAEREESMFQDIGEEDNRMDEIMAKMNNSSISQDM